MQVVGGVLSPAHDAYVRGQCRRFPAQAIPVRHRVAMAELAVEGSSWLSVRRWEATRRTVMDYRSVLKNVQQVSASARAFGFSRPSHTIAVAVAVPVARVSD